ncbi:MAG: ChaN family lipoprotein [Gammaproteobacteria bacterium]|nr:ChaN family lipoprotein [Gammaproteobacteria bacterium]
MKGFAGSLLVGSLLVGNAAWAATNTACVAPGQWLHISDNKKLTPTDAIRDLAAQQVVLLGEDHDNVQHHRWQLHTIAKLHALQPDMAIGFESFPRRLQPVLDRWINGELTEKEFLKATDWENIWAYDANYYMPMFQFARMHHIPIYAMNVDRSLIQRIGQNGWASIPAEEREGISDPAPATEEYVNSLADIFSQHMPHNSGEQKKFNVTDPGFLRFVQSQQIWDRAMAETAHRAVGQDKHRLFVGIVGAGHIMGGYGIPYQLKDLGDHTLRTLMPWDGAIDCDLLQPGLADLAFGMTPPDKDNDATQKKHRQMLGIYLEPSEKGIGVTKLVPGSLAEAMGMKTGDVIVQVAGSPVSKVNDVVDVVKNMPRGTWLPITVQRGNKTLELIAKFPPHKHSAE